MSSDHAEQPARDRQQAAEPELADVLPFPSNRPATTPEVADEPGLRTLIGQVLRDERCRQERVLAEVADAASVSLPYLSEVERGRKEISSDLLDAVVDALDLTLAEVLERCVERLHARSEGGSGIQLRAA